MFDAHYIRPDWLQRTNQVGKCASLILPGLLAGLLAGGAHAAKPSLADTQAALRAARAAAAAHHEAASTAVARASAAAAAAAVLAQQQIAADAALRGLETATGADASRLASLLAQSQAQQAQLRADEAALTRLLPTMQRLSRQPEALLLATPAPPADTVRGLLLMQGIAAQIARQAEVVRDRAAQLATLTAQTRAQAATLAAAAAAQNQAESALTGQIAAAKATEMQAASTAAGETAAALAADARISSLRDMLARLRQPPPVIPPGTAKALAGAPVAGAIAVPFGADTVAGPAEGVSYRAAPGARVTAPCSGPVLFANRFQSYGLLVILDCGGGYDFVLSGMAHLDVAAGEPVTTGQPVGEMQTYDPRNPASQPLLYVELRRGGTPVNPSSWPASAR